MRVKGMTMRVRIDKIVEALRRLALVESVLLEHFPEGLKILFENGFAGLNHVMLV